MKKLKFVIIPVVIVVVAACLIVSAIKKEEKRRNKDYERIETIRYIFTEYVKKNEYEKLDCVITYQGQKGLNVDAPTKIDGDEEFVKKFLTDITSKYSKEMKFESHRMRNSKYDKVVFTIKNGRVSVAYDKCD